MFFNNLPFPLYSVLVFSLIPLSIVGYVQYMKKTPGHPAKWLMLYMIPFAFVLFLKRYVYVIPTDKVLLSITKIVFVFSSLLFFIVLIITMYLSYKWGYADQKKIQALKPTFKNMLIALVIIFFIVFFLKISGNI